MQEKLENVSYYVKFFFLDFLSSLSTANNVALKPQNSSIVSSTLNAWLELQIFYLQFWCIFSLLLPTLVAKVDMSGPSTIIIDWRKKLLENHFPFDHNSNLRASETSTKIIYGLSILNQSL